MILLAMCLSGAALAQQAEAPPEVEALRAEAASYVLHPAFSELLEDPLFSGAEVALQVVNVRTGEEVFGWRPDEALVPASTMKVLTAATALRNLGPAWRFRTEVLRTGEITADGVLEGDLIIRGTGDPTLVVEKAWKLIQDLQIQGITEVNGDVIFDDTYLGGGHLIPGWTKEVDLANGPAYFAPLGALSMNFNTVDLIIAPGPEEGEPARVQLGTPSSLVTLESEVETVRAGRRPWIRIERELAKKGAGVTFKLAGRIAADDSVHRYYRAVSQPLYWTMSVFEGLLEEEGIKVSGKLRADETPEDAEQVVSLVSPPLHEVLNHTLKHSNNLMAENILRVVGAEVFGAPGTTEKGIRAVEAYLSSLGVPEGEFSLVNGSGLTRDARLRPSHLNAVLVDMYHDPLLAPEFLAALSVSGVDGTLRRRFDDDTEVARMRGKTGSLNGVYCLAAYGQAGDGETYAFSFLVNGFERSRPVRALHDAFGSALLAWEGPPLASGEAGGAP